MKTYADAKKEQEEKALIVNDGAVQNTSGKQYNPSINYTAEMQKAEQSGNWAAAADNEKLHNTKDGDLGLGWGVSDKYNYIDRNGYGGQLQAKRNEIENYKPFSYDYRTDDSYLAMKRLKEQEADKAYADGYAQLSTAFDGDIPVNMINKLLTTKNEIINSADSYIPQLRQMAYDMYNVERNDLYNQYGLLQNEAQQDYGRWSADRDVRIQGLQNAIENEYRNKVYDRGVYEGDRSFNYGVQTHKEAMDYTVRNDIASYANQLFKSGLFSYDTALKMAKEYYLGAANAPSSPANEGSYSSSSSGKKSKSQTEQKETYQNPVDGVNVSFYVDENGNIKYV